MKFDVQINPNLARHVEHLIKQEIEGRARKMMENTSEFYEAVDEQIIAELKTCRINFWPDGDGITMTLSGIDVMGDYGRDLKEYIQTAEFEYDEECYQKLTNLKHSLESLALDVEQRLIDLRERNVDI